MKKRILAFLTVCFIALSFDFTAYASVYVSAESAVLMCANSGEVLFSRNADKKLSMASTTKIMTSLLALEAAKPEAEITVSEEMVSVEGTSMGLLPGDRVSLRELVYGMLLQSGNDAANTVAYVISGSPEQFAKLMNERAKQIGMKNSCFVTPSGLDEENHYSTAYDMALLACESLKNPEFASICSQKSARLTYGNPPYARTLTNHNKLLWKYGDSIGIKTGFTKKSGRCLVSAAERDGVTLVAVTLNAPDDWNDHIAMFEYGFSKLRGVYLGCDLSRLKLKIAGGVKSGIPVELAGHPGWISGESCRVRLLIKPMVYAPVKKGDIVGTAVFLAADGDFIAETAVIASEDVERKRAEVIRNETPKEGVFSDFIRKIKDFFGFSEVK
ncbi:MAG: D-alanyl-D-alanine carboxypeptidase [Clostridia bacterium]|nr:D-alanyl-D-alanine carboxypeptidase [Clostridia bacterium]